jgi:hypothetical protein
MVNLQAKLIRPKRQLGSDHRVSRGALIYQVVQTSARPPGAGYVG